MEVINTEQTMAAMITLWSHHKFRKH